MREKVEGGKTGDRTQVTIGEEHRDDIGRILGVAWELSGKPVTLRVLRDGLSKAGADLDTLLTAVGGPLRDKPAERRRAAEAKQQLRSESTDLLSDVGVPRPVAELAIARRWLGPEPQAVASVVAAAWSALPTQPGSTGGQLGTVGLAEFAGQELLNPHALDRDQPAGRAVARLLAATFAYLDHGSACGDAPQAVAIEAVDDPLEAAVDSAGAVLRAQSWRGTWARAGISCDQVSSTVLVLNMPLESANPALKKVTAVTGEPVWLTARMTLSACHIPVNWTTISPERGGRQRNGVEASQMIVRVCENPSVIEAAANRLGAACPPLVCLYGRPSSAAWSVLSAIVAGGARILLSTDRDVAGEQIAAEVSALIGRRFGPARVSPWLPSENGVFEEERLTALLADLTNDASAGW
ncbi:TIGR02679 domain-containing protein [Pseudarthrobacter sp. YS3]|uniref:TIGR02679 domain-containing protein n=1 Tax=Pseudarthrobacter sp. YS3 TaxID=3453718 RepID=UPI003EEBD2B8